MKDIALAILVVGLCLYEAVLVINDKEADPIAGFVAIVASIALIS